MMPSTEELLREILRDNVSAAPPPSPDRYPQVNRRIRLGRRRRALAAAAGTAAVAAVTVALVTQFGAASHPTRIGTAGGGPSPQNTGPTLPPPAYRGNQHLASLSGVTHDWTDGIHSVTVTAGGTLAITTECLGTGTLSVSIGQVTTPLTTMSCDVVVPSGQNMQIATITPSDYPTYGLQPGSPVTITVTRSGGDSDQWRIEVLRNPSTNQAQPSSSD